MTYVCCRPAPQLCERLEDAVSMVTNKSVASSHSFFRVYPSIHPSILQVFRRRRPVLYDEAVPPFSVVSFQDTYLLTDLSTCEFCLLQRIVGNHQEKTHVEREQEEEALVVIFASD